MYGITNFCKKNNFWKQKKISVLIVKNLISFVLMALLIINFYFIYLLHVCMEICFS